MRPGVEHDQDGAVLADASERVVQVDLTLGDLFDACDDEAVEVVVGPAPGQGRS